MKTRRYFNIFCLCSLLLGLCGCEKVVEFKPEDITPYVVVMSRPVADSLVSVKLSYSQFFLSNREFEPVKDARIRLLRNGSAVSLLEAAEGMYTFDCRPQAGDSLELHLDVPSYAHIHAGTRVPQKPSVEAELLVDTLADYVYRCQLKVKIHDPAGSDFYRLSVDGWDWYVSAVDEDTVYIPVSLGLSTNDMVFTDVSSLDYLLEGGETEVYGQQFLFSDELFNGRVYTMTFSFDMYELPYDFKNHPLVLKISSFSKDLFRYQRTKEASFNGMDFLSEPVQIYCNIDGGIGIFAASANEKIILVPVYR